MTAQKMTWDEIKKHYPDKWVSLIDIERNKDGMISGGVVTAAGPDLKTVTQKLKKQNMLSDAFKYTGRVKNFLGFTKWEITDVEADR